MSKTHSKRQNRRPEPRKQTNECYTYYTPLANLVFLTLIFFGTMRLFFENFSIARKIPLATGRLFKNP